MPGHKPSVPSPAASALAPPSPERAPAPAFARRASLEVELSSTTRMTASHAPAWTFDAVYEEYFPFVWRSVRRLGVVESAVDDVVQDVFVVVHRRLGAFEGTGAIKSWLFGIALRVVKDLRRTLRRKPAQLGGNGQTDDDVDGVVDAKSTGPHESLAKAEAVRTLHAVLDAMPDERKEVFILAELEQMTVPEIADAIGTNVNTTYSRLRAARADFDRAVARARAADEWRAR